MFSTKCNSLLIFGTIIFLCTIFFTGCANSFISSKPSSIEKIDNKNHAHQNNQSKQCIISGSFKIYESFSRKADSETFSERTAFPAMPSELSCTVYAENTADSSEKYSGTPSDDFTSYTLIIPTADSAKTYKIKAALISDEKEIFKGESTEFTISPETTITTQNITLTAEQTSTGKGNILLEIQIENGCGITKCKTSLDNTNNLVNENKITIQKNNISSGATTADFLFYDDSDTLLYKFTDVLNIYDNLTTNAWVQNGFSPYLQTQTGSNGNKTTICKITKSLIKSFKLTTIYVDASRSTTTGASNYTTQTGTFFNPKTNLTDALTLINDSNEHFTIYITGTLTGVQTIPSSIAAKSLKIIGTGTTPTINGNNNGTTLTIETSVPVQIQNLTITGGNKASGFGGGIAINSTQAYVELGNGVNVTGNTAENGGGIYNIGKLYLNGTTVIGKKGNSLPSTTDFGNQATKSGAGIYNEGEVYLGYKYDPDVSEKYTKAEFDGGIYRNISTYSNGYGGGIYSIEGKILMYQTPEKDCAVSYNSCNHGAGIALGFSNSKTATVYMDGGCIEGNDCDIGSSGSNGNGGGIYCGENCSITMKEGSLIKNNKATYGGGVLLKSKGILTMTGGTIEGNTSTNTTAGHGGGIYLCAAGATNFSKLTLSGSAYIPCNKEKLKNDVYFQDSYASISLAGNLTKKEVACISGETTVIKKGTTVLTNEGDTSYIAANCGKFNIISNDSTSYLINYEGKIIEAYTETEAITAISNLTGESKVKISGSLQSTSLGLAIKNRYAQDSSLSIELDLSSATISNVSSFRLNTRHGIKTLILPDSLGTGFDYENVAHDAGEDIEEFIISSSNPNYTTEDGVLYNKNKTKLITYPKAKTDTTFTLPSTVTSLGSSAFIKTKPETINGLNQLRSITTDAFYYCTNLKEADLSGLTDTTLAMYAFENCRSLQKVIISSSVTNFSYNVFNECRNLKEVHFKGTTPPKLTRANDTPEFNNCHSDLKFYVPSGSKSTYLNSTNFNTSEINYFADSLSSRIIEE